MIYSRFERLETEYYSITQALKRIEARLIDGIKAREIMEIEVKELKKQVILLLGRIEDVEERIRTS